MTNFMVVKTRFVRFCCVTVGVLILISATASVSFAQQSRQIVQKSLHSIGRYTYSGPGTVNTFWIETASGLIVIDVQRDLIHARKALAAIERRHKPVIAILITHGHPDHTVGLGIFKKAFPDASVYSSQATYDTIRTDPHGYMPFVRQIPGNEKIERIPLPDHIFKDEETLNIGGIAIETHELGRGHSDSATLYYLPTTKELFVGDIVCYKAHMFFLEGHSDEQLSGLKRLSVLYSPTVVVLPGHGESAPFKDALRDQIEYLTTVKGLVAKTLGDKDSLDDSGIRRLVGEITNRYPKRLFPAGQPNLIELNVRALVKDLVTERTVKEKTT